MRPVAVQAGDEHSAAVTRDGELYLWGRGDSGQLGVGDVRGRCRPTLLPGFAVVHPGECKPSQCQKPQAMVGEVIVSQSS